MNNNKKICTKCYTEKELEEFHWRNISKGYKENRCKDCKKR